MEITTLKARNDIHLARRLYHSIGVCIILALYSYLPRPYMMALFTCFTVVCVFIDIFRQKFPQLNEKFAKTFRMFIRESEVKNLTGMSFITLGILTISIVFPPEVVKLSLLMKDKIVGNKSLQGTIAGFVVCALVSAIYFLSYGLYLDRIILISIICGIIGAVSELLPVRDLDDNFTFPIISSILLWSLFQAIGM
jgi:diacylglycerol kinase (CTP)